MILSAYEFMWVLAMFDLPVLTKKQKRNYVEFRNKLLDDGFDMMQFSVYVRHCGNKENAEVHLNRIGQVLPQDGELRVMLFTDKQFQKMRKFGKGYSRQLAKATKQLEIF